MIAKKCGVPTLLWGPRDEAPLADGSRLRDSLCGMLATSGVLHNLRVRFTYLDNCRIDDAEFQRGVDRFVRAARVVKTMRSMRIGQVGQRIDFFWSTIVNESDLLERFGIQVLPIDLTNIIHAVRDRVAANRTAYQEELARFRQWISFNHYRSDDDILPNFALRDLLLELAREEKLDGFCVQTFSSIQNELHSTLSFGLSLVSDEGIPVAPESDLYGAISSVLIESASATGRTVVPARHRQPASGKRERGALVARRRAVVAPRPRLAGQIGCSVDTKGLADRADALQAQGRTADPVPFRRRRRRLSPGKRRRPYRCRTLYPGVLRVDGGGRLGEMGTPTCGGAVHSSRILLLRSLCGCSGRGDAIYPRPSIRTIRLPRRMQSLTLSNERNDR